MNEATIYTAPDANITITDDTVEHIIYNTHTIKIDRNRLKEITPNCSANWQKWQKSWSYSLKRTL